MNTIASKALSEVNVIRVQHGAKRLTRIRKGRDESQNCPVALSLADVLRDVSIGVCEIRYLDAEGWPVRQIHSAGIAAFIQAYDAGQLPEYKRAD